MASTKRDLEEKKRMDEAVRKVREVVHTASKNDIVLALHIYDLDVDKTIQAFCDDGAQNALGSWKNTSDAKKKNRKKKKDSPNPELDSKVSIAPVSKQVAKPPKRTENTTPRILNGVKSSLGPKTSGMHKSVPFAGARILPSPAVIIQPPHNMNVYKGTDSEEETSSIGISSLKNFDEEIKAVEVGFEKKISLAEDSIRLVFQGISQLLRDRENHLLAELRRTHDDGIRVLNDRRVRANELLDRAKRIKAMSDREKKGFCDEVAHFSAERNDEEEFAHATRFACDKKLIVKIIKNFGEVMEIKVPTAITSDNISPLPSGDVGVVNEVKNPLGRSSRTSSAGEDSGLGQISPTGEEHKQVAEVNDGGISMKSDALTADQLADLNAKVRETLLAKGIDTTMFSGLKAAPRRRPGGGARGRQRVPKPPPHKPDPHLSIFE